MPQEWVLTVSFSPNGVEVEIGGEPDFHIDIRQFAQAFMGEPSLATLRSIELVEVRNEEGFAAATRLLTPMPTVCSDFF
jgi:hypothetical protein